MQYIHLQYTEIITNRGILSLFMEPMSHNYGVEIKLSQLLGTVVLLDNDISYDAGACASLTTHRLEKCSK